MIVVTGESLVDMIGDGDSGPFIAVPGGSPFNVALAAGRLGLPTAFLGRFSSDDLGGRLREVLDGGGVDLGWCPETEEPTTKAFITIDPATKAPSYRFETEGTAGCGLAAGDLPAELPPEVEALHAGSFSLLVEPIASTIAELLGRECRSRVISVDPNIRPMLIGDREEALERLHAVLSMADVIKVSDEDLAWFEPAGGAEGFMDEWLNRGASLVIVTLGAEGSMAASRDATAVAPAPPTTLVDSVGAGDTFQAALLRWLHLEGRLHKEGMEQLERPALEDLLRFAGRAAAVTCSRAGCDPPWANEL